MKTLFIIISLIWYTNRIQSQSPTFTAFDNVSNVTAIKPYFDSAFVLIGPYDNNGGSYAVVKADLNGNILSSTKISAINANQEIQFVDITVNTDSSIVIVGNLTYENNAGNPIDLDLFAIKINQYDSLLYCKTIRDTSINKHNQRCVNITSTEDKGAVITGYSYSDAVSHLGILASIIKLDTAGNNVWSYQYKSGSKGITPIDVAELPNGDIVVTCLLESSSTTKYMSILRLSSSGNVIQSRNYKIPHAAIKIINHNDSTLFGLSDKPLSLYSIDIFGEIKWQKRYTKDIRDAIKMPDGSFFFTGISTIPAVNSLMGNHNYLLAKTDSLGVPIWAKNYGRCQTEYSHTIESISNQILISGPLQLTENANYNAGYLITDPNGNAPCQFNNDTIAYFIDQIPTSEIVSVSKTLWLGTDDYPVSFSSISTQIIDVCAIQDTCIDIVWGIDDTKHQSVAIFPNPFSDNIVFQSPTEEEFDVSVSNLMGQHIWKNTFINSIIINTEQFKAGIYLYEIVNKKRTIIQTGKIIKQ